MYVNNPWGVPNQFIIHDDEGNTYFQSYTTLIAKQDRYGKVWLSEKWNCSKTTSKYRSQFLGEDTATTKTKIKNGEYVVVKDLPQTEVPKPEQSVFGGEIAGQLFFRYNGAHNSLGKPIIILVGVMTVLDEKDVPTEAIVPFSGRYSERGINATMMFDFAQNKEMQARGMDASCLLREPWWSA